MADLCRLTKRRSDQTTKGRLDRRRVRGDKVTEAIRGKRWIGRHTEIVREEVERGREIEENWKSIRDREE